jgi:hypothetical protein
MLETDEKACKSTAQTLLSEHFVIELGWPEERKMK